MKKILLILFLFLFGAIGTSQAYSNVSFSFSFHDALSPYGTWVNYSSYGNVWRPRVHAGWSPYTEGHWIYTSHGPMWDSPEPYAWATYHYGRWVYSASYGWIWVPGYEWYPSRVSWAYGDDYLGWSPVYPAPSYSNVNLWFFIDRNHFGYDNYSRYYIHGDRVRPLFQRRAVQIRNARLDRRDFERFARRPIKIHSVRERTLEADRHRVRMVVPQHRETTVVRELSRAQKQRVTRDRDRDNRVIETRNSKVVKQSPRSNREVTTKYSSKKLIVKPSSKSKVSSYNRSNVQQKSQKSTIKQSPKKSYKPPVKYSNRYSSKSKPAVKSFTNKSTVREVSRKPVVKQSPPKSRVVTRQSIEKSRVVTGKYSSNKRPDIKHSSKQVNPVSRKEVRMSPAKKAAPKAAPKQNRRPPQKQKKH